MDNKIDRLITAIETAEDPASVTNEMVAEALSIIHDENTGVIDAITDVGNNLNSEINARIEGDAGLSARIDQAQADIEAIRHPIEVEDTDTADLIIAAEDGTPIATFADGHIKTASFDSANIHTESEHPVEVEDTDSADLIIAAEDGTPIATFAGGHIRTAQFDSATACAGASAPSATNAAMQGLKLSILGDSISTFSGTMPQGYATFYPNNGITSAEMTWWRITADTLGMTVLKNCSWSGSKVCGDSSSTTSAAAGCSDRRIADLADGSSTPDVIIIWIGINDWGDSDAPVGDFNDKTELPAGTISEFGAAYATAVIKAQRTYPRARIYCCTLLDVYQSYNNIPDKTYPRLSPRGQTIIDYNRKIAEVCSITGATLIDIHSCGINYWTHSEYLPDGLHPNAPGAALIAKRVINTLLNT